MSSERGIVRRLNSEQQLIELLGVKQGEATHYQVLGVEKTAELPEIKRAYHQKSREMHPDKGGDAAVMSQLGKAYNILSGTFSRAAYDTLLELGQPLDPNRERALRRQLEDLSVLVAAEERAQQAGEDFDAGVDPLTGEASGAIRKVLKTDEKIKYLSDSYTQYEFFEKDLTKIISDLDAIESENQKKLKSNEKLHEKLQEIQASNRTVRQWARMLRTGEKPSDSEVMDEVGVYFYYKTDDLSLNVTYRKVAPNKPIVHLVLDKILQEKVEDLFASNNNDLLEDKSKLDQLMFMIFPSLSEVVQKKSFEYGEEIKKNILQILRLIPQDGAEWLLKDKKWVDLVKKLNIPLNDLLENSLVNLWPNICELLKPKITNFEDFILKIREIADKKYAFKQKRDTVLILRTIVIVVNQYSDFSKSFLIVGQIYPKIMLAAFLKLMLDLRPVMFNEGFNFLHIDAAVVSVVEAQEAEEMLSQIDPKNLSQFPQLMAKLPRCNFLENELENELGCLLDFFDRRPEKKMSGRVFLSFARIDFKGWCSFSEMIIEAGIIKQMGLSEALELIVNIYGYLVDMNKVECLDVFDVVASAFIKEVLFEIDQLLVRIKYPLERLNNLKSLLVVARLENETGFVFSQAEKRTVPEDGSNKQKKDTELGVDLYKMSESFFSKVQQKGKEQLKEIQIFIGNNTMGNSNG